MNKSDQKTNPPFSLINSYPPSDRPGAVQGAKRRSGPLTARTDLESFGARERGPAGRCQSSRKKGTSSRHFIGLSPFLQRPFLGAVPSLPAGINTDDSDPLGPDRGAAPQCRYRGQEEPPFRGGVAIVFPDFSVSSLWKPNSRGKPKTTKEFKESVGAPPPRFFMPRPPLCPWGTK